MYIMANKINYQAVMEQLVKENCTNDKIPKLLLHSCCGPCSTYCIEILAEYFEVPEDLIQQAVDYYTGPCGLVFLENNDGDS